MKKQLYFFVLMTFVVMTAFGQSWTIYGGDAAPADNTDPVWNGSNGTEGTWTVEADPDVEGNNVVVHESLGAGSGMYKTDDFNPIPEQLTTVFRVKHGPQTSDGVFEMDLHVNGIRDQLIVYSDNTLKLTRSNVTVDLTGRLDVNQWNVFRITLDASSGTEGVVRIYLNEDPVPVLTATSTTTTTSKYLRFGDGQSSVTYSSYIDFILFDTTGVYNPTQFEVPDGLIPEVSQGSWTIYSADAAPADNTDPVWNGSNGTEGTWTVEADPDVDDNNVVVHESLGAGSGMYKTDDFNPIPEGLTTVFRVKQGPQTAGGVFEMDLHVNGIRDQLIVYSDNTVKLTRSDTTIDLSGKLDVSEWNVFRMTLDASAGTEGLVNIYLNEDPTPVLTTTSTTTTSSKYLRFGDGQSSVTYSSYIDFIVYDTTGAFSPDYTTLPQGISPAPRQGDWSIYTADAAPADNTDPVWNGSNGTEGTWTVEADPDVEGNNVVVHESLGAGSGMYKTDDFNPIPEGLTTVFRVKQGPQTAGGVFEMDLHVNGIRDQLIIYSDNTLKLTRSDTTIDLSGTMDVSQWNVFRMTVDANSGTEGAVNIYLNEDPNPVLTTTSTTTTSSKYLRFGDGQSSVTYSSYIDFIVFDTTGAYSPSYVSIPEGLLPTDEVVIPEGEWTIYTADFAPADNTDPVWNGSNGTEGTWTVEVDPDVDNNNYVIHESLGAGSGMYKTDNFNPAPQALTTVFRVKMGPETADGVAEMDLHVNGIRDQLIIYSDNTMKLTRSDSTIDLSGTLDVRNWNVFRMTVDASSGTEGIVNIYLNEEKDPVLTTTSTTTTTSKYLRFGDGQSSVTYSSYIDFIVWDTTGAYSPVQTSLPAGLIPTPKVGDWSIYTADSAPADNTDPVWNGSNGTEGTWTVEADPDVTDNNIVVHESLGAGSGMYKTDNFNPVPQQLTTAFRVKKGPQTADGVFEMDLHVNGIRDQLIVYSDNTIRLTRSDTTIDLSGSLDVTEWNTFRMSVDASAGTEGLVNIYLNEEPTPVLTTTSTTTTTSQYLRFGDGQSGVTYSSYIDFIAWDTTGAYNPQQRILPPGLIPGTELEVGEDAAYLADLTVDGETIGGFLSSVFEYNVELPPLTTVVPTVAATALYETATIQVNDAASLPGTTTVVVTGEGNATQTYTINFTVAPNTDATLTAIQVDGVAVDGFSAETTFYEVAVPYGSTDIPAITATTTDANASYEVSYPNELPGLATITVTAEDGSTTREYKVNLIFEVSSDASLSDLLIDNETIAGFAPETTSYNVELNSFRVPGVLAITNHPRAAAFVTYPNEIPGSAVVNVTAEDGETTRVYTIEFTTTAVVILGADDLNKVRVYPNPVRNTLTVHNALDVQEVKVYTMKGELVRRFVADQKNSQIDLDVASLENGVYLVKVLMRDERVLNLKVVK